MQSHGWQHHRFDLISIRELHNTFQLEYIQLFTYSIQSLNLAIEMNTYLRKNNTKHEPRDKRKRENL